MKKFKIVALSLLVLFTAASFKKQARPDAPNFTLESLDGKMVSLSSFKGKTVYIDVWATWCKPCLMEIPYSKKLKERFAGNDSIAFVYISIDNNDNIQGWKDMVAKKEMGGTHLISRGGQEEKLLDRYAIATIPRFIVIDKEGKIAYFNAPAPSNPATYDALKKIISE